MNKLDRMYRKALKAAGSKAEHDKFLRSLRAMAVYADICSRCYAERIDFPDLKSGEGMSLLEALYARHKYECSIEEFLSWYAEQDTEKGRVPEDGKEMIRYFAECSGGEGHEAAHG